MLLPVVHARFRREESWAYLRLDSIWAPAVRCLKSPLAIGPMPTSKSPISVKIS
jgi:hypothetical protein